MNQAASEPGGTSASPRGGTPPARRYHLVLLTEGFFAERPPAYVVLASILLTGGVFAADVATSGRLSPSLLYLLPVALTTWRLGRRGGVVVAGLSAISWTVSDMMTHVYGGDRFAPAWNLAMRFGVLSVIASLLTAIRTTMRAERELADEAIDAADALRGINEVKDTLLHAISHDLRGSIAAILGSAQSLQRRGSLALTETDQDVLVDGILQSGRKLDRMVGDLLDLERLDRGLVEPERAATDLGALVARVADEALSTERHPILVEIVDPIEIDVDPGEVERIVENLLANAVKHTPDHTPIRVRVERRREGALLSVEDEGPGVPDELKASIFQPFRQGVGVRSGAGIGLSLVAKFTELHGGTAWVEDRAGGGAAFRVFLPGPVRVATSRDRSPAASI